MPGCPSGQRKRTVNPPAYAFRSSNLLPGTESPPLTFCEGRAFFIFRRCVISMRRGRRKAIVTWRFAFNDRSGLLFQRLQRSGHTETVGSQHRGCAPLAQSAERFHGKEKVVSSILTGGSVVCTALVATNTWRCSSVVEQATHNRCVASSILAIATHLKTGNAFPVVGLGTLFTVS